jgi:hypothetical protein
MLLCAGPCYIAAREERDRQQGVAVFLHAGSRTGQKKHCHIKAAFKS